MHPEPVVAGMIDIIDLALQELAKAEQLAPAAIRAWAEDLNTFGVPWPDWAKDSAYHLNLGTFLFELGVWKESLSLVRSVLGMFGLPSVLRSTAQTFKDSILGKLDSLFSQMDLSRLNGEDYDVWQSEATEHYTGAYEEQRDHLIVIKDRSEQIIESLNEAADAQEAFFTESSLAVIGFEISAAGLAVAIATGVTGVGALIGLIISAVGLVVSFLSLAYTFFSSSSEAQSIGVKLRGEPLPHWPRSAFST